MTRLCKVGMLNKTYNQQAYNCSGLLQLLLLLYGKNIEAYGVDKGPF